MSWHIMCVESLAHPSEHDSDQPMLKTDYFIAILNNQAKQDSHATGAIIKKVLQKHKEKNLFGSKFA